MRVLVVDDSATLRKAAVNCLNRLGFLDVVEAIDGLEALERFDASIRLVITDWNMPRMTGIDLARALRGRGETVPILLIATRSVREDSLAAAEAGVDCYLTKPLTPDGLREKLDLLTAA